MRALPLLLVLALGCTDPAPTSAPAALEGSPAVAAPPSEARVLADAAIAAHGGDVLEHAELAFSFRGTPYRLRRDGGRFEYARTTTDANGRVIVDVLGNDGLRRTVDGTPTAIPPDEARGIETTVNSVAYFALLPFPLRDPAVRLQTLGSDTLRGVAYDRLEATFAQEGGGRDWEDRYLYWLHPETRTVDFLAYTYELGANETGPNATGSRFREAFNAWTVGGVRVQDYHNLTASVERLEDYAAAYRADTLRLVSEIVLDSVRVTSL